MRTNPYMSLVWAQCSIPHLTITGTAISDSMRCTAPAKIESIWHGVGKASMLALEALWAAPAADLWSPPPARCRGPPLTTSSQ